MVQVDAHRNRELTGDRADHRNEDVSVHVVDFTLRGLNDDRSV